MKTPGLVPPFKIYWEYFASKETNPFTDNFAAVMAAVYQVAFILLG